MSLPVPSYTKPFWLSEPHELASHCSTDDIPAEQDVVIVGSGFAGSAAAYYLTQSPDAPMHITVLEAREACSGATGRNGGHVRPEGMATFTKFGANPNIALDIANFELENAEAVKQLVQELDIDCDFEEIMSSNSYMDEQLAQTAKELHQRLTGKGYDFIKRFTFHDADSAPGVVGIPDAKGAVTFPAATIWPYKFVMHLLSVAVSKGVNLQTNTPVESISSSRDADGYWTLQTSRGPTRAKTVILATNGYTRHLLPDYADHIVPVRGTCSHIVTAASSTVAHQSGEERMPAISPSVRSTSIKHSPGCYDYLVSRADGSIVVGGAWKVVLPGPRADWHGVTDDSAVVPLAQTYYDGFMERTYEAWRQTPSRVDYLWTGILGFTSDGMPHVGHVDGKPGVLLCAGFNGHGMPQVLLSAKGVAKMALEGCAFSETGIPAAWETAPQPLRGDAEIGAGRAGQAGE